MHYLQGTNHFMLTYRWIGYLEVTGYFDTNFIGCVDSKSTSGYIFKLASGAVSWVSMKQTLTTTSTMEAEFVSCFEATSHGVCLKSFIASLRSLIPSKDHKNYIVTTQLLFFGLRMTKVEVEVNTST